MWEVGILAIHPKKYRPREKSAGVGVGLFPLQNIVEGLLEGAGVRTRKFLLK